MTKKNKKQTTARAHEPEYPDWSPIDEWYMVDILRPGENKELMERDERFCKLPIVAAVTVAADFGERNATGVFCPVHNRWESVKRIDSRSMLTTERGCQIKGRIVQVSLTMEEWLIRRGRDVAVSGWHIVQNSPCGDLTVYTEIIRIALKDEVVSGEDSVVKVIPLIRTERYVIDFKWVSINSTVNARGIIGNQFSFFGEVKSQPVIFPREIEERVLELMKATFKRQLGIAPTYTDVRGYDRIAAYLLYPFDMNLPCLFSALYHENYKDFYKRVKSLKEDENCPDELKRRRGVGDGWRSIFPRNETDNFPLICKIYGLKPTKGLRRVYAKNPVGFWVHISMLEMGFKDVNIISHYYDQGEKLGITQYKNTPKDLFGNCRQYSILYKSYRKGMLFYLSKVIEAKGERSGAIALERLIKSYNLGDWDKCRMLDDTLRMYDEFYDSLPVEYQQDFINNGPTRAIHDRLSVLITARMNQDREFCVSHEQKALEGEVENMSLRLATNVNMLCDIGGILHNCVASYSELAATGKSIIFYAVSDKKLAACIELQPSEKGFALHQALGKYNQRLSSEEQRLILRWVRENNIALACNHLEEAVRAETKEKVKTPVWKLVTKERVTG